jgi:hypothetical protein
MHKGRNHRGEQTWGRYCQFHHKATGGLPEDAKQQGHILNKECEVCGWDKAYCDRHRVEPSLGYTRANVQVLCPNCHRLATLGILQAEEAESRS